MDINPSLCKYKYMKKLFSVKCFGFYIKPPSEQCYL